MNRSERAFTCIASGSFSQANERFPDESRNRQCLAISACALGWMSTGGQFRRSTIDAVLDKGDAIYRLAHGEHIYMNPEELPLEFEILGRQIRIVENVSVIEDRYPLSPAELKHNVIELAGYLDREMTDAGPKVGFLFTGQEVTVSIWRSHNKLYLFDSHAVNERRKHDFCYEGNNKARLFRCENYLALASLLLSNAALDGGRRWYSITRLAFEHVQLTSDANLDNMVASQENVLDIPKLQPVVVTQPKILGNNNELVGLNSLTDPVFVLKPSIFRNEEALEVDTEGDEIQKFDRHSVYDYTADPKLKMNPVVDLYRISIPKDCFVPEKKRGRGRPKGIKRGRPKTLDTIRDDQIPEAKKPNNLLEVNKDADTCVSVSQDCSVPEKKRGPGRPKGIKRGRPKTLDTTRDDQISEAKKKYTKDHPEVNRDAVKRYTDDHPEVNRDAVKRYTDDHPEVHRDAVKRYTDDHPEVHRDAVKQYDKNHPDASNNRKKQFRLNNPTLECLRHLPVTLSRKIVEHGPMGYWNGDLLEPIQIFKLKKSSLWEPDIFRCEMCKAPLYEEEKDRKKWCCGGGAYNVLRLTPLSAPFYRDLRFLQRSRAYNDLFAFSATEVTGGYRHPSGLSFFKIEGRMYHQVHSLDAIGQKFTAAGGVTQFVNRCRLYIDDGEERRRIAEGRHLDPEIIKKIESWLKATNPFITQFKQLSREPSVKAHLNFEVTNRATHGPQLGDKQTGMEVHAVLSTDEVCCNYSNLSVWKVGQGRPTSIPTFSALMEPFQYPLLFPEGTPGWTIGRKDNFGNKLSQIDYARCLILSDWRFSLLGRVSQSWEVEMFARIEEEKLGFVKRAQTGGGLRIGPLDELVQATTDAEPFGRSVVADIQADETVRGEGGIKAGKIYLPCTFTGSPRYMKTHYENAMGLVCRLGSPTFFLTFTYAATWEENKKACPHGSQRSDPSTACRIFKIKLTELLRDLRSGAMFGKPAYIVYVIEMQMRGLPHAHIVFRLEGGGPVQAEDIDSVTRADIPSEAEAGGRLRRLVLRHMIHGPCGTDHRTDFSCWDSKKGYCQKFYPKPAVATTHVDERGFVQYRRDYNNVAEITSRGKKVLVHDGWVVPYNPALLLKYEAHINLEVASTRRVIKYLFKYLMKGGSLQNVTVVPLHKQIDEVEHYVTKRMIGASDAAWRILGFDLSRSEPTVECLPVHLEGKQSILFRANDLREAVSKASSKLLIYFNRPEGSQFDELTYQAFYENYIIHTRRPNDRTGVQVFDHPDGKRYVTARQRGQKVCRLDWVAPNRGEQFYLRVLLMTVPCRGYVDLLSRGGLECNTFQDLARRLGLVDDEQEYHQALREASEFMVGSKLRSFFVILCNMGAPAALLWEKLRTTICEDHLERNPNDPERAYKLALIEIDRSLRRQGSCLADHGLPCAEDGTTELGRELLCYGENQEAAFVAAWEPRLSSDQRSVLLHVRSLIDGNADANASRVLFLDGPGGYGKTLLLKVILADVRSRRKVALAVASSGIAAGNLPGGTTAHSMFRLPLDLKGGFGVWNITNGSQRAELIFAAQIIVFDEAPMAHHHIFEILNRSLKDLMDSGRPFGGKIFLASGDFRQIAPVVEKARTPLDVVRVSLRSSSMWQDFRVYGLTTPQRTAGEAVYSEFLLRVGEGTVQPVNIGEEAALQSVIPLEGIRFVTKLADFVNDVFPTNILRDPDQCAKRAILATLNANVKEINHRILNMLDSKLHYLRSVDTMDKEAEDGFEVESELMNQATGKGVPDHILALKVGSVCLVTRNLNIADGLVNGTKVIVTNISPRLITVRIPGGATLYGIPRITFKFALVEGSPLRICRRQFPLMLAYSMTGHKSQGQTIEYVGVDLRTDCFTHGQLYVLLSRVRSPENLLVLVPEQRIREGVAHAKNIVYNDMLL